jgi:hypothetical protein
MADWEMYDVLPTIPPDVNITLSVDCQVVLSEEGGYLQEKHTTDDNTRSVITFSDVPEIRCTLQWPHLDSATTGTILDIYYNTTKAFGMAKSIKWDHPSDGHTYVISFESKIRREWYPSPNIVAVQAIDVVVLGKIAD